MKLIPDSALCLLRLLLLAQLFVHSASRPAPNKSLCRAFGPMISQLDQLSKKLHNLTDNKRVAAGNRLERLPNIQQTAADISSMKLNASLAQLYVDTQAFKLHVDWLKTASENVTLPSQPAEATSAHLDELSKLLNMSLHQINQEPPQLPSYSLPDVDSTFDVLQCAAEISEGLKVFCSWSKRVLRYLKKTHCP